MYRVVVAGSVIAILTLSAAHAESQNKEAKAVTIPLDQIWSNGMPGTRDIDELNRQGINEFKTDLLIQISASLLKTGEALAPQRANAKPGFAVTGEGLTAMRSAYKVLATGENAAAITHGDDVTLVFFMYPTANDVQVRSVERQGKDIEIAYFFVGYAERNLSTRFAMIPMGKLPVGKYEVKLVQLSAMQRHGKTLVPTSPPTKLASANEVISQPFSFNVREREQ